MTKCNFWNFKKIILWTALMTLSCGATWAQASVPSTKTTVIYFGQQRAEEFELKIKPLFLEKSRPCKNCEIVNYTPYNKDGEVDMESLLERLESLPSGTSFVFFDFNFRINDDNRAVLDLLNKKADSGLVVVGSAGAPKPSEASGPLSRTLLGQTHGALIIGELSERDRLMPTAFYGPEMLTALRPPKEIMGQGYGPLIFAANLAESWQKRSAVDWVEYLKTKKMKTRKLWLDLNDMF
ncbi:MAG TPA: hypothetical protein VGE46_05640 [Bdellovibrio sp.]